MTVDALAQDYHTYTEVLIDRGVASGALGAVAAANGLSEKEALAWSVSVMASGHLPAPRTPGQEGQGLSAWHRFVRDRCTNRYADLQQATPDANKEELNSDPELVRLNAVREGLGRAMRTSYAYAEQRSRLRGGSVTRLLAK